MVHLMVFHPANFGKIDTIKRIPELNPVPFGQDQALALGILKAAQFGQLEN